MTTVGINPAQRPAAVSGVQLAQGVGVQEAKGFWEDAWSSVLKRRGAVLGLIWISIVGFFAVFSPLIANGHPWVLNQLDENGRVVATSFPLIRHLSAVDILLLIGGVLGPLWIFLPLPLKRSERLAILVLGAVQAGITVVVCHLIAGYLGQRDASDWARSVDLSLLNSGWLRLAAAGGVAALVGGVFLAIPGKSPLVRRLAIVGLVALVAAVVVSQRWREPLVRFDYARREAAKQITATYTLIPFSPTQGDTELYVLPPGTSIEKGRRGGVKSATAPAEGAAPAPVDTSPRFLLGTDPLGQDVLSQLLHACRLSISIGLVSTGIAVFIGVTVGALAGYFGGWVDLILQRVIEVFMAIPVLFLLIVAAGVLPAEMRTTYVMMAIIGAVTWTGAARFTRAEFYKLRSQDFVQSARAVGLPLPSILFKHMLPNGVTPVLVDASFAVAFAIIYEATLSYLGLGPVGQASWGKLLHGATGTTGNFVWWLAIFPGAAIFLTVLSYNLIGEALRDAIDPKLKKARV